MTKKRKQTLAIVAVTAIWMAGELIACASYLGYLAYRDVRDEIAVLKVQHADDIARLSDATAQLTGCETEVERLGRVVVADKLLKRITPEPLPPPETK